MTLRNWIKEFYKSIYNEIWGEPITHPLLGRPIAFAIDVFLIFLMDGLLFLAGIRLVANESLILSLTIGIVYFTILNSKVGKGKTIGKRLLNLKVVDERGEYINVWKSFLRGLPIVLIINFQIIAYVMHLEELPFIWIMNLLVIFAFGICYFSIIKLNRQGLHDLLVGTQVLKKNDRTSTEKNLSLQVVLGYVLMVTIYLIYFIVAFGFLALYK